MRSASTQQSWQRIRYRPPGCSWLRGVVIAGSYDPASGNVRHGFADAPGGSAGHVPACEGAALGFVDPPPGEVFGGEVGGDVRDEPPFAGGDDVAAMVADGVVPFFEAEAGGGVARTARPQTMPKWTHGRSVHAEGSCRKCRMRRAQPSHPPAVGLPSAG